MNNITNPFKFDSLVDDIFFTDRVNELAKISDIIHSENHLRNPKTRTFSKK